METRCSTRPQFNTGATSDNAIRRAKVAPNISEGKGKLMFAEVIRRLGPNPNGLQLGRQQT